MPRIRLSFRLGFTLLEMVIVVAILAVVAGLLIFNAGPVQDNAQLQTTITTLQAVKQAINGTPGSAGSGALPGYRHDMRAINVAQMSLPPSLASLYSAPAGASVYDPVNKIGWHGPYLNGDSVTYTINAAQGFTTYYSASGDPAPADSWSHPVVLQIPAADPSYTRLVSAGANGKIETPLNYVDSSGRPYPPQSMRGDDVVLFLFRADVPPAP